MIKIERLAGGFAVRENAHLPTLEHEIRHSVVPVFLVDCMLFVVFCVFRERYGECGVVY